MTLTRVSLSLAVGIALLVAGAFTASAVVHPPDVNPDDFSSPPVIDNRYYPLVPGTVFVYEGETDGVPTRTTVCVTQDTTTIEGVVTRVIHDQAFEWDGNKYVLVEDTFDWFAQDDSGNVWYFGEDTTELPSGSKEGSWEAGVDDADAGFIMLADPQRGDRYYQEFARNVAEDQAKVLGRIPSMTVRGVIYEDVLWTQETSRFDPSVLEYKYYAPDVGLIRSVIVKGGNEFTELVSVTPGTSCQ